MASERVLCELEELLAYLVALLGAQADLEGAKVLGEDTADLVSEIARQLNLLGLSVLVAIPEAMPRKIQSARSAVDATVTVTIAENVLLNRKKTGKSALYIATRVLAQLNLHEPPFAWCGALVPHAPGMDKLNILADPTRDARDQPAIVAWQLSFLIQVAILPRATSN